MKLTSPFSATLFSFFMLASTVALPITSYAEDIQKAIFAAGCFWCVEAEFQKQEGVLDAVSGFTGGTLENPTYKGDHSGHVEAVEVTYDAEQVSYEELLTLYWKNVDPYDDEGQFCDRGYSYTSAIFVFGDEQRKLAEQSRHHIQQSFAEQHNRQTIVTPIRDAMRFYPVVEYHQDYYKKNPIRYRFYRSRCGRDARLKELWGRQ